MFVVQLLNSKGGDTYKEIAESKEAEAYWIALIDKVSDKTLKIDEVITVTMFVSSAENPAHARMDVMEGKAKKQKSVTYRAPKDLRGKVVRNGPKAVSAKTLKQADMLVMDKVDDYLGWAQGDLVELQALLDQAVKGHENIEALLSKMFKICYRLKGQGGTFGYQLVTLIADKLGDFIEATEHLGRADAEIVQVHINSMKLVMVKGMSGAGGSSGEHLLSRLEEVSEKIVQRKAVSGGPDGPAPSQAPDQGGG